MQIPQKNFEFIDECNVTAASPYQKGKNCVIMLKPIPNRLNGKLYCSKLREALQVGYTCHMRMSCSTFKSYISKKQYMHKI